MFFSNDIIITIKEQFEKRKKKPLLDFNQISIPLGNFDILQMFLSFTFAEKYFWQE